MSKQSILRSAILTALLVVPFTHAADSSKAREALMQSERDWAHAWSTKDSKAIEWEANEYTYTDFDGAVSDRAADIELLKSPTMSLAYEVDDMKATLFGNVGVVVGRQNQKGNTDGRDVSGVFRFTDTWIKRDGRWQCVAAQLTRIEKP